MKRMQWIALIIAALMTFGICWAAAESAAFPEPWDTGMDVLWLLVPWEDESVDLWFGVRFNENREALDGVTLNIDILEKAGKDWGELFTLLDQDGRIEPDPDNLMLMDISLKDEFGEAVTPEGLNLTMFIQTPDGWKNGDLQFRYVSSAADEDYSLTEVVQAHPGEDGLLTEEDDFFSVDMTHFSPFAAYLQRPVVTPTPVPVTPTPLPIGTATPAPVVPATGDSTQLSLLAGLMKLAAGMTVVFAGCLRRRSRG